MTAKLAFHSRRPCGMHCSGRCTFAGRHRASAAASPSPPEPGPGMSGSQAVDSTALPASFCIIEDRSTVQDFANLQLDEIRSSITARRNRIFLLMEEVRRLRIQERLKGGYPRRSISQEVQEEVSSDHLKSALPFLPELTEANLPGYYKAYYATVAGIIVFGGLIAPILEVRLGLGGTTYQEFITSLHLPGQLSAVDPIVASFCGGAVGVLSALLLVEVKNIKAQQASRCLYCSGTGYLECGECTGAGCSECSFTGKVMCTSCLCTGKKLATEHDPRADPFD